jgi:hypothetical protein
MKDNPSNPSAPHISRKEAVDLMRSSSKFSHSLYTGRIMSAVAHQLGEDEEEWELAGILYDLDFDQTETNREKHGIIAAEMLEGRLSEKALNAIRAHDHRTGVEPQDVLGRALKCVDALATFLGMAEKEGVPFDLESLEYRLNNLTSKPWLKDLIYACSKIGFNVKDFVKIGLDTRNLKTH